MSNTIDSSLAVKKLLAKSIPLQAAAIPKVETFCTILDLGLQAGRTATIANVTAVQAVQENPTSFENSGDTIAAAEIAATHFSAQFGLANADRNSGLDASLQIASHLEKLQLAIQAKIFGLFTAANYGTGATVASAAWAEAGFQTMTAAVPGRTVLALSPAWFVKTQAQWCPPGVEKLVTECSNFTGAEANVCGFVARPESVALCVGYPQAGPVGETLTDMLDLPIGLRIQRSIWFARASRSIRVSLDVICAPQIGKSAALRLLKSA